MFEAKRTITKTASVNKSSSSFVNAGLKTSAETRSGNDALKYSTTGNDFVDQFGSAGNYKEPRSFALISRDCELLWASNPLLCVVFILYLRTINRVVTLFNGLSTKIAQKGAELKHEAIFRMIWLHIKQPSTFWKNIGLFVSVGSWKDIITILQYDLVYNGWSKRVLDWEQFGNLILTGLENKQTVDLIKKYLPQIKAKSYCTTIESDADTQIGKWICFLLFGEKTFHYVSGEEPLTTDGKNYKRYRKLKASGTAHTWQQLISRQEFERIDFSKIHGRALSLLVRSKFLKNHGLEDKYNAWVEKPETKVKYTGFVHELFSVCSKYPALVSMPKAEQNTINKQFDTLVSKAGEKKVTKLIVARDISGSMEYNAPACNMSSKDVAKAIALFFSEFLTGYFANAFITFSRTATMHQWRGNTPLERWYNDGFAQCANTNFMGVIELFCQIKLSGVKEDDFPTGILCISDGEFDKTNLDTTNIHAIYDLLKHVGFSKEYIDNFVVVLWNIPNDFYGRDRGTKFETYGPVPNIFYFGGYSASVISFLSEKIKTPEELFLAAMNQEILNLVEL
jgi:hypothetical protein